MSSRRRIPVALIVVTMVAAACGVPAVGPPGDVASQKPTADAAVKTTRATATSATPETKTVAYAEKGITTIGGNADFECPVTIPAQPGFIASIPENVTYSDHFPAPDPWPREYPHEGTVWYGSEELWTALAIDGDHSPRKSMWWSVNFPGGIVEGEPEVWVTWTRLDTDEPIVSDNGGKATNAFTGAEGWFMIAGIDPNEAGCWEVEATYKGASLSYVYEKTG